MTKHGSIATLYVLIIRFIEYVKSYVSKATGLLTTNELSRAQTLWIESCKSSTFSKEIKIQKNILTSKSWNTCMTTVIISGLRQPLTVWIHNALVSHYAKFPYLLLTKHQFTTLIVYASHANQLHGGVQSTVTPLRQHYWIPAACQVFGRLLKKCIEYHLVVGKPFAVLDSPPLPQTRVQKGPPFDVTGIDFTGAMYVKNEGSFGESKV